MYLASTAGIATRAVLAIAVAAMSSVGRSGAAAGADVVSLTWPDAD